MPESLLPTTDPWPPRRVAVATLVIVGVAILFGLVYWLHMMLFLWFVAVIVATALGPLIGWLERLGATHTAAVGAVYIVSAALVGGLTVLGAPYLLDQAVGLAAHIPRDYNQLREQLLRSENSWIVRLAGELPADVPLAFGAQAMERTLDTLSGTLALAAIGLRGLLISAAVLLISFYWSLQIDRTTRWLLLLLPAGRRDDVRELASQMRSKVGAYLLGQGVLCIVVAVMAAVAYSVIGLPYAILLGVVAGVLEAIPFFGPILGAVAPMVVALSVDSGKVFWVLLAAVAIQQMENYLLVPRVMDRSVGVHPITTLLAIAGFGALFGVLGAVLAIPLAAIVQVFLERVLLSPEAMESRQPLARDRPSVLRYQAQEIVQDMRLRSRDSARVPGSPLNQVEELIESIAQQLDHELAGKTGEENGSAAGSRGSQEGRPT